MARNADPDPSLPVGAELARSSDDVSRAGTRIERARPLHGKDRRAAILLWFGVIFGFLVLTSAWFFLFRAARAAHVESVPLATQKARP